MQADKPIRAKHSGRVDVWCDYRTAHQRTAHARGKASEHTCIDCGEQAEQWAYRGDGRYEFTGHHAGYRTVWSGDPADYDPRCRPCHRKYDSVSTV